MQSSCGGVAAGYPTVICTDDAKKDKHLPEQLAPLIVASRCAVMSRTLHVPYIRRDANMWLPSHGTAPASLAGPTFVDTARGYPVLHGRALQMVTQGTVVKQDKYHSRARVTDKFPPCATYGSSNCNALMSTNVAFLCCRDHAPCFLQASSAGCACREESEEDIGTAARRRHACVTSRGRAVP
jgi:hypothetical protein